MSPGSLEPQRELGKGMLYRRIHWALQLRIWTGHCFLQRSLSTAQRSFLETTFTCLDPGEWCGILLNFVIKACWEAISEENPEQMASWHWWRLPSQYCSWGEKVRSVESTGFNRIPKRISTQRDRWNWSDLPIWGRWVLASTQRSLCLLCTHGGSLSIIINSSVQLFLDLFSPDFPVCEAINGRGDVAWPLKDKDERREI